jgi:CheY-like chemotaxis protein
MENPRIGLIEDVDGLREALKLYLKHMGGLAIAAEAVNRDEAFQLIDKVADGSQPLDVIITDYNLSGGTSCRDGQDITQRIEDRIDRQRQPLLVIGFSAQAAERKDIKVDKAIPKENFSDLVKTILDY